jgi:hypothetical protein
MEFAPGIAADDPDRFLNESYTTIDMDISQTPAKQPGPSQQLPAATPTHQEEENDGIDMEVQIVNEVRGGTSSSRFGGGMDMSVMREKQQRQQQVEQRVQQQIHQQLGRASPTSAFANAPNIQLHPQHMVSAIQSNRL